MSQRVNTKDYLETDKVEISAYLEYNKKYLSLSNSARRLYGILFKRFSLTQFNYEKHMDENLEKGVEDEFTYIDEHGDLFCLCSNAELRFWLRKSDGKYPTENTIINLKKELAEFGLLEEVKQTNYRPNKLYVYKAEMDEKHKEVFDQEKRAFKVAEKERQKEKNKVTRAKNKEKNPRKTERLKNLKKLGIDPKTHRRKGKGNCKTPNSTCVSSEPKKISVHEYGSDFSAVENIDILVEPKKSEVHGTHVKPQPSTKESFSTKETKDIKIVNKEGSVDNPNQQSLFDFENQIDQAKKEREQLKSICFKWATKEHSRFGKAYWEKIINLFVDDLVRCDSDGNRRIDGIKNVDGYIRRSMSNIANKKFLKSNKHLLFRYTIESYNVHSTSFFFHEVQEQFEIEVVPDAWFDLFSEIFLENQLAWQVLNVLVEFTLTYTGEFKREFIEPVVVQMVRKKIRTAEQAIGHFENHQPVKMQNRGN